MIDGAYVPFIRQKFRGFGQLVQDNAPCHKSRATLKRLEELGVTCLPWSAGSPDLNPIELVWGNTKAHIREKPIRTLEEIKIAIVQYWKTLLLCSKYIGGMKKKLERAIEQGGRNILEGKRS
ncbi:hypothetical protein Q1695_000511 [Nippostrongylus brasiliensis]|nr:hypothetical protein Q1695_000511 [Nippostrongylus brasiliensis]